MIRTTRSAESSDNHLIAVCSRPRGAEGTFYARDFHSVPGTLLKLASALSNADYGWRLDCSIMR